MLKKGMGIGPGMLANLNDQRVICLAEAGEEAE